MRRYAVVIEQAEDGGFGGYVPDLPGCAVCGYSTPAEAKAALSEAVAMHLAGMIEDGETIPEPTTLTDYVTVDAA
jgi:predicted RNase H-like HicB family nuclease